MANEIEDWKQKPPCSIDTEICNRGHGKRKDSQSSKGYSHFFKIMLGDFAQKLRIPPAFVHQLSDETADDIALEGPTGHQWPITLWRASTEVEFREGWGSFVSDQRIELGDFLVFKYIGRSHFQVKIFGRSGCEKNITVCEFEKKRSDLQRKRSPATPSTCIVNCSFHQPIKSKVPVRLVFGEEEKNVQAGAVLKAKSSSRGKKNVRCGQQIVARKKNSTPKSAGPETEEKSYVGAYYVSCRRPVTEAEKNKAVQEANSFTSDNPFYLLVMRQSNVYQGFWLNVPRQCADHLCLPRQRIELTLVDPNNKEWDVKYLGDRSSPGLSGGWKYLSIDNNLEQDDVCILERIDESKIKCKIRVHVYRVVKNCTPYRRMEGKGISDSAALPLPKKHFKKKMKVSRERSAIISSEKVVKHEQVKKEKASSGSNCHKQVESKCTPSISERKADCWNNPRPNGICNLSGSPRELRYSALSANGQQSVGRDTMVLSKETTSLDDFNADDKKGMEIVCHSNAVTPIMPPNSGELVLFKKSMLEGPSMNSTIPVPNLEYEAQLSPEEGTCLVDMNDPENCITVSV